MLLLTLVLGLTLGSSAARGALSCADLAQASGASIGSALIGGAIFNLANILLVAAIEIAGMAVAFPVGIGLALLIGVIVNYLAAPVGNGALLAAGVVLVTLAIVLDAVAYRRLAGGATGVSTKGLVLSVACGIFMGMFYRFVAAAMYADPAARRDRQDGAVRGGVCVRGGRVPQQFHLEHVRHEASPSSAPRWGLRITSRAASTPT